MQWLLEEQAPSLRPDDIHETARRLSRMFAEVGRATEADLRVLDTLRGLFDVAAKLTLH